ncbi:MFS transporter [Rathayibacter soli]|uniref:MFS transporter n=1 Tax=Rathayibacter soli TaxID=3144168 RepID=UPI0027E4FE0B|nr:MFS transporter [Glaciibacter superstes]
MSNPNYPTEPPLPDVLADELPIPVADGPNIGPAMMQKRMWVMYPLAAFAISVVWGSILQQLFARQIAGFASNAVSAPILGAVVSVGAIVAIFAQPIVGRLSDRTRTRFLGRRNIWTLGTAVVSAIGLLLLPLAQDGIWLGVLWAVVIFPLNGYQIATTATFPERVPVRSQPSMSGIYGAVSLLGIFGGVAVGGLVHNLFLAYAIVAAQLLIVAVLFAIGTKDYVPVAAKPGKKASSPLPGFRDHRNYWWALFARFVAFLAYTIATALHVYVLRDYIHIGSLEKASIAAVQMSGVSTLAVLVAALVVGVLASKTGRLKVFVIASTLIFIPGCVVALIAPTFTGMLVAYGILGFGFGAYLAVDQALIAQVLPKAADAGRDLGIANIANAGPQIFAPVLAGALVAVAGYPPLWVIAIVLTIAASVAILPIRGIR